MFDSAHCRTAVRGGGQRANALSEPEGFGMHEGMKTPKLFAVALAFGVLLVQPALGEDPHAKCCVEAKKAGKECAHHAACRPRRTARSVRSARRPQTRRSLRKPFGWCLEAFRHRRASRNPIRSAMGPSRERVARPRADSD